MTIFRAIEERIAKEVGVSQVRAHTPVEVAAYLLNEQRDTIACIETKQGVQLMIVPHVHMTAPHFEIECLQSQVRLNKSSYRLALEFKQTVDKEKVDFAVDMPTLEHVPAIQHMALPEKPKEVTGSSPRSAVTKKPAAKKGLLSRLMDAVFTDKPSEEADAAAPQEGNRRPYRQHSTQNRRYPSGNGGNRRPSNGNRRSSNYRGGERRSSSSTAGPRPPRSENDGDGV